MSAMSGAGAEVPPPSAEVAAYHGKKHRVFQRMYADQTAYRALMRDA